MHIDINSCFATIEQQANPTLRYTPIVVAAYNSPGGCILAPSIEAKTYGIKTGMRVKEAKLLYPRLIVMTPDPDKYRDVHLKLRKILFDFSNDVHAKSIDEFVLNFEGYPWENQLKQIALDIKQRIRKEIGDYIRVSVGIAPNRFLAKTAAGLKKPDGLEEINHKNYLDVYSKLNLVDLHGIYIRNELRLNNAGINSVLELYNSPLWKLRVAFKSINAYYWYLRLRGWEIDNIEFERKSYGNSFALPTSEGTTKELFPILQKLCEKTGSRMRAGGYKARGIHLSLSFRDHTYWHEGDSLSSFIFDSKDIYKEAVRLLSHTRLKPVHVIAVSVFGLTEEKTLQFSLFENLEKKQRLVNALDTINDNWGDFLITPARMVLTADMIKDRIAFGGVREL
ncbi:hypothetical protein KW795_02805 [Candidatus Microgenomates bacterium]|nr:hypothetical protein [Candidatus Microgenomates bacterium]